MQKTVVIHQPDFVPYIGFFQRFLNADLYIVLDHAQFVNGSSRAWTHRDKIKTAAGEKWLSISTKKVPRNTAINQVELSTEINWKEKNLQLLDINYKNAPFYREIIPIVEKLYSESCERLAEFNLKSIEMLMELLDIKIPWMLSSNMDPQGSKNELLVDLLQKAEATSYLSGVGAKAYLEEKPFLDANIKVVWQEFEHPVYPQQFNEFIPYLSSLDMLFNCGIIQSRKILRGS